MISPVQHMKVRAKQDLIKGDWIAVAEDGGVWQCEAANGGLVGGMLEPTKTGEYGTALVSLPLLEMSDFELDTTMKRELSESISGSVVSLCRGYRIGANQ